MNGNCMFYRTMFVILFLSWMELKEIHAAEVTFVPQEDGRPTILAKNGDGAYEWHMQSARHRWVSYDINIPTGPSDPQLFGVYADVGDLILKVNTVDADNLLRPQDVNTYVYHPPTNSPTIVSPSTPAATPTLDRTLNNGRILRLEPAQIERPDFRNPLLAPPSYLMPQGADYAKGLALTGEKFGENVTLVDWDWEPDPPEEIPTRFTELPVSVPDRGSVLMGGFMHQPDQGVIGAIASESGIDVIGLGDMSHPGAILSAEVVLIGTILVIGVIEPTSMALGRTANGKPFVGFQDGRFLRVVGIDSENGTMMPVDRQPLPPETTTAMAFVDPNSNQLHYMAHLGNQNEIIEGRFGRAPRRRIYLEGDIDRLVSAGDTFEDLFVAKGSANVNFDRGFLVPEGDSSAIVEARNRATAIVAGDESGHAVKQFHAIGNDALLVREVMEGQSLSGVFRAEGQRMAIAAATTKEGENFDATKFIQEHHSNQLTEHLLGLLQQPNMNARLAGAFLDTDIDPLAEPGELFASLMPVDGTNPDHGFFSPKSAEVILKAAAQPGSIKESLNTSVALDGDWSTDRDEVAYPDFVLAATANSYSLVISNGLSGVAPQVDEFHANANRNVGQHGLLMMFEDTKMATESSTEVKFNVNAEQLIDFFDGDFMHPNFVYDGNVGGSDIGEMEFELGHSTPDGQRQTLLAVRGTPQEVAEQLQNKSLAIFSDGFESGNTTAFYRLRSPDGLPVSFSNDAGVLLVPTVEGSFDFDDKLDKADINRLSEAVRSGDPNLFFDVNLDGQVAPSDRIHWVNELKNTYFGDANLDGEFNTGDLIKVFQVGKYEDGVTGNSNWEDGDWDGNGDFETGDLVVAFQFGGYETGPRSDNVVSVPEPSVNVATALLLGLLIIRVSPKLFRH